MTEVHSSSNSRRITMADIAAEAGVSAPTVSKVINGRSEVALSTRRRVEAVIRRHGYEPRRSANAENPGLIDLVLFQMSDAWALEIVRGVEEVVAEAGLNVVLTDLGGKRTPNRDWIDRITSRRSAGVILLVSDLSPQQRAQLTARKVPYVVVDPAEDLQPDVPSVGVTNWDGGLTATRHLLALGHTRIGMITGPPDLLNAQARRDGYHCALETAGLRPDPELVRGGGFTVEAGVTLGQELLELPDPPTAIFAACDLLAFGVYEAARHAGLRIPQDLSVVGFDDLPFARWMWPPLTTIRQPLAEMAAAAARMILTIGRGEIPGNRRVELATSLVDRDSTAVPARAGQSG